MGQDRGLVMEVKKRTCIVLTSDGLFLEVSRPRGEVEIGSEIHYSRSVLHLFKPYLAVASILVAALAWFAFNAMLPRAVAYVSLDINPSVELGIDRGARIVSAKGINEDGQRLLKKVAILNEPLKDGLQKIIYGCIEYKYLQPQGDNLVLVTFTGIQSKELEYSADAIYENLYAPISNSGVNAELIVTETDNKTVKEANNHGVTPGRYLLQKELEKKGVTITNQEIRAQKIRELEQEKNFRASELIKHTSKNNSQQQKQLEPKKQENTPRGVDDNGKKLLPRGNGYLSTEKDNSKKGNTRGEQDITSPGNGSGRKDNPQPNTGQDNRGKGNPSGRSSKEDVKKSESPGSSLKENSHQEEKPSNGFDKKDDVKDDVNNAKDRPDKKAEKKETPQGRQDKKTEGKKNADKEKQNPWGAKTFVNTAQNDIKGIKEDNNNWLSIFDIEDKIKKWEKAK